MRSLVAQRFLACFAAASLVGLMAGKAEAVILAGSATDVCSSVADPCVVVDTVQVISGSVLDFGLRALEVGVGGQFDFADGFGSILCGSFTATSVTSTAIGLRATGGTAGGSAIIEARGSCSGDPARPCLIDTECSVVSAGVCSGGNGTISLVGKISGNAQTPADLTLRAAGNVSISGPVDLDGTISTAGGGTLVVISTRGNVVIDGDLNAQGGGLDSGGVVSLDAGGDIVLRGAMDLRGGDFDGGVFAATAAGELRVENDILLDAKAGEGFGGDLALVAGGNLTVTGGTSASPILLRANGSTSIDNFGGDGGYHLLSAGATLSLGAFVKVIANGALPDGSGGDIDIAAATVSIDGVVESRGNGGFAGGGVIDVFAGAIAVSSSGRIDAGSASGDGGDISLLSDGDILIASLIDAAGGGGAAAGSVLVDGAATVTIQGTVATDGATSLGNNIRVSGCSLLVASGGLIDNSSTGGGNTLVGRGFVTIAAGAQVLADTVSGLNSIVYGNPAFPPSLNGTVSPSPTAVFDDTLPSCAACSVAADCDDSNPCTDDSCDLAGGCMNIANANACDDGNPCTTDDVCAAGQCTGQVPAACNDGNLCTDDSCLFDGTCVNTPNMAPCDDGTTCTTGDVCTAGVCVGQAPAICDDADPCTRDTCDDVSGCVNTPGPVPTCLLAPRARLQINNRTGASKDRLKWKWDKGAAFAAADAGTPDATTGYTMCIYDTSASVSSIAARLDVAAGGSWTQKGRKWKYKDKAGTSSGVDKMEIRFGALGKTKLRLSAKGVNLPMPTPVASDRLFSQDPTVSVQLINSEGTCWSAGFASAQTNDADRFKARVP